MNDFSVQQGWQCPICKRVYSPFTPVCAYCGGESIISTGVDYVKKESTTGIGKLDIGGYTIIYPLRGEEE